MLSGFGTYYIKIAKLAHYIGTPRNRFLLIVWEKLLLSSVDFNNIIRINIINKEFE